MMIRITKIITIIIIIIIIIICYLHHEGTRGHEILSQVFKGFNSSHFIRILLKCVIKSPSFIYKFLLLELSLTGIVHPSNWLTGPLDAWIIFANVSLFFSGKTNTSTWRLILTPRLKLFV